MAKKESLNSYCNWKQNYKLSNKNKTLGVQPVIQKSDDTFLKVPLKEPSETRESSILELECITKMANEEDPSYFRYSSIEPKNLFCGMEGNTSESKPVLQNKSEINDALITKSSDRNSFQSTSPLVNIQNNCGSKKVKITVTHEEKQFNSSNKVADANSKEEKARLCLVSCAILMILLCAVVASIQAVKSINLKGTFF